MFLSDHDKPTPFPGHGNDDGVSPSGEVADSPLPACLTYIKLGHAVLDEEKGCRDLQLFLLPEPHLIEEMRSLVGRTRMGDSLRHAGIRVVLTFEMLVR